MGERIIKIKLELFSTFIKEEKDETGTANEAALMEMIDQAIEKKIDPLENRIEEQEKQITTILLR